MESFIKQASKSSQICYSRLKNPSKAQLLGTYMCPWPTIYMTSTIQFYKITVMRFSKVLLLTQGNISYIFYFLTSFSLASFTTEISVLFLELG